MHITIMCKNLWSFYHPYRYHRTQWSKGETIKKAENEMSIFATEGLPILFLVNSFFLSPLCSMVFIYVSAPKNTMR